MRISKCFQLLFYICRNNEKNKKQCLRYIEHILVYHHKEEIIDLLTELLIDNANSYAIEKTVTPAFIEAQLQDFVQRGSYSSIFMRIFRVFCGSDDQPSLRNQTLLFGLFFWGAEGDSAHAPRAFKLPNRFKFRVFEQDGAIYFSNEASQELY
jgi:hypothetical protein